MKIENRDGILFFGNSLFGRQETDISDRIAQKKQMYQKQGMHLTITAHRGEKKLDDGMEQSRERARLLMEENDEINERLRGIKEKMAQAKEDYQIADDSQEEQDLELMKKAYDLRKHGGTLTEEEWQRLDELGEPTEYQRLSMELYEQADTCKQDISQNMRKAAAETAAVRQTRLERLKTHGMLDAQKAKEDLLAAASEEVISMLKADVKDKIDEKTEELQEAAEERKEKEEEEQERIDAAKENRTEAEQAVENARENAKELTEQAVKSEDVSLDIDEEVKKIMEEQKLLEEELKGLAVDFSA